MQTQPLKILTSRNKVKESIVEENKFTTAATRVRGAGKRTGESE